MTFKANDDECGSGYTLFYHNKDKEIPLSGGENYGIRITIGD
jgi:hypothetical protein